MQGFLHRCKVRVVLLSWLLPMGLSAAPKPTDVVAVVDSFRITVADVQKKLSDGVRIRSGADADKLKQEAVNELIYQYLAGVRARFLPVENDSAFMQQADRLLAGMATQELFNRAVLSAVAVSDSEATEPYRQDPKNFIREAWVHASHLLITPVKDTLLLTNRQKETGWWAKTDDEAKWIADSLYRMVQAGLPFDSLAGEWSQDMASGMNGGDLGSFAPGRMVPEFDSVAFHLPVGSVSPPVKTRFGFHLVKVFSRQKRGIAPLTDSLKNAFKQQILNQKVNLRTKVFMDSLYEAAELAYNVKVFDLPDSVLAAEKIWAVASRFGDTVWSDRFATQLALARSIAPGGKEDRDYKTALLKDAISPLLLRRMAADLKITESQAYLARKEEIFQNERLRLVLKGANMEYNPTQEETEEYYRQHKPDFLPSESLSVHVQQMVFKTRKEAERVVQELRAGGDFALLARKYFPGDSDIAQEAFDLGFIAPPAVPGNFFAVAETLAVGAVSQPVRTRWGYHLMRVLGRRPDLSFEAARPKIVVAIRKAKQEEHKRKWEAALREGHAISIKEQVLKSIKFDPSRVGVSGQP